MNPTIDRPRRAVQFEQSLRADAGTDEAPSVGVIRDDGVLVVRGVIFSDAPTMEFVNGELVDLTVTFDEATLRRIRKRSNGSRALLRDHGEDEHGLPFSRSHIQHVLGKMTNLALAKRGKLNVIESDFLFDPELAVDERGNSLIGPIQRETLNNLSAGWSWIRGSLKQVAEATARKRAQWTAKLQDIGEGSLVGLQADPNSGLSRKTTMPPEPRATDDPDIEAEVTRRVAAQLVAGSQARAALEREEQDNQRYREMSVNAARSFGADAANRMRAAANGDPEEMATQIQMHEAARTAELGDTGEDQPPLIIPTPRPPLSASDGTSNHTRAYEELQIMVLARGLPLNDPQRDVYRAKAAERGIDIEAPCVAFLIGAADSLGLQHRAYSAGGRLALVEALRKRGAAAGGMGPSELPEVYRDTVNLAIEAGHSRVALPEALMGNRVNLEDFRQTNVARWDIASNWKELPTSAELSVFKMIDASYFLKADQYGGLLRIDDRMIANDRVGALAGIPNAIGAYIAEQETRIWVAVLTNGFLPSGYTGVHDIDVADPLAFAGFVQSIKLAALTTQPVADDNSQLKSTEPQSVTTDMIPTMIMYGPLAEQAWVEYATPVANLPGAGETRAQVHRTNFVKTLFQNGVEVIHLGTTAQETYYRPQGLQDGMSWGRVSGRERRVTIAEAPIDRISGQAIKVETTFGVKMVKDTTFRVRQT